MTDLKENIKAELEKQFKRAKRDPKTKQKESKKRSNLIASIKGHGGHAFAIENICFAGMADMYGETPDGEPFWIELKRNYNKLSPKQHDFFKIIKVQKYIVTFFKKCCILYDVNTNTRYEYASIKEVTEHILHLKRS